MIILDKKEVPANHSCPNCARPLELLSVPDEYHSIPAENRKAIIICVYCYSVLMLERDHFILLSDDDIKEFGQAFQFRIKTSIDAFKLFDSIRNTREN